MSGQGKLFWMQIMDADAHEGGTALVSEINYCMMSLSGEAGKVPTPLTKLDIKRRDTYHCWGGCTGSENCNTLWITGTSRYVTCQNPPPSLTWPVLNQLTWRQLAQLDLIRKSPLVTLPFQPISCLSDASFLFLQCTLHVLQCNSFLSNAFLFLQCISHFSDVLLKT